MPKRTTTNKKGKKIATVAVVISLVVLLFSVGLLVSSTVSLVKKGVVEIFGYTLHIVVTDSMSPEINVGDLVIAKSVDNSQIGIGDDIVFVSDDPALRGNKVVHRVVGKKPDGTFVTSGIKEGAYNDSYAVASTIGKVCVVNAELGVVISFLLKIRQWLFVVLLIAIVLISLLEAFNIAFTVRTVKKARAEVKEELRKEMEMELVGKERNE